MRNSVVHVIELLLGALLLGLGLLYLESQYRALSRLSDATTLSKIEDKHIFEQCGLTDINQVSDKEVYAIMGYRQYPIMVDDFLLPINGHDYELYFTYIKSGYYKKKYQYDENRRIVMILYTYMGI